MRYYKIIYALLSLSILFAACNKSEENSEDITQQDKFRGPVVPPHFPPMHYSFENNPITEAGVDLGKKLFYDKRLSIDNTISCGSCHAQVHAFADHGTILSSGVEGRTGIRNSPAMQNIAWHTSFMWDGGINHIEVMPIAPISDHNEMNFNMFDLEVRLNNDADYRSLFHHAFGTDTITAPRILKALAQFMSMMISADSKYDRVVLGKETFTPIEQQGYALFQQHCNTCHTAPLMTDYSFRNNGIAAIDNNDDGRYRITLLEEDKGKFKVPSLRNVTLTHPYMHDGRIAQLRTVLEMYANGVPDHPNRDPLLSQPFALSEADIDAMHAFLYTLEDYTFLSNPLLAEP